MRTPLLPPLLPPVFDRALTDAIVAGVLRAVLWASHDWLTFSGFSAPEIVGHPLDVLCSPDATVMNQLREAVGRQASTRISMASHTKHGVAFGHTLEMHPLVNSCGTVTLLKLRSAQVELLLERGVLLPTASSIAVHNEISFVQPMPREGALEMP